VVFFEFLRQIGYGEAEEAIQTVFLSIFGSATNFDPQMGLLKVWLLQYAYYRALHRKRHLVANHFYRLEKLEAAIESGSSRTLVGHTQETISQREFHGILARMAPFRSFQHRARLAPFASGLLG
jgi:DNA-directed RNA polymerase specialized sigma24 family protein